MDCVVLAVTVAWYLCWPVIELNLVVELDLIGRVCRAVALLDLLVVGLGV